MVFLVFAFVLWFGSKCYEDLSWGLKQGEPWLSLEIASSFLGLCASVGFFVWLSYESWS